MDKLTRFGVSLEKELLSKFDLHIKKQNCPARSKAIADLIRKELVKSEWIKGKTVVAAITLVYDHHKKKLISKLIDIQHDTHGLIISSQHIHLDHNNCFEIIIVKGAPQKIKSLADKLKSVKGVKHSSLTAATTGKEI
ncbi:MAG: nickel-responsive transcriptional regulator NikR [Candidatus Omnitrophota bacterium]|nr:nickel-responsive transcriptional regulator NikR [Candidatus Omnitrophota bacterium]MBU2527843.1 nickel-responsive transcriptional regulator NikR [bacterium]MBU3930758.1 nickel-responsive transcriptional regulator NikR [bacterium]MBU4123308.1 nickel-responsive transcriptional regulator NikR [bacterium]